MPFVKGKSGNPNGRPREPIRDILESIGKQKVQTPSGRMSKKKLMWTAIYNEATRGNVKAAALLAEREEGKMPIAMDLTSQGERVDCTQVAQVLDFSRFTAEELVKFMERTQPIANNT
jgi:hypothetical protein